MKKDFSKLIEGYQKFRKKYARSDQSVMGLLANQGQKPRVMVVSCCDSRVDPALILQCDPGDLFVVRNVANIIPPYEKDEAHHGTSAALEFGVRFLEVEHLILLGHSQCGGIESLFSTASPEDYQTDFIGNWVSLIKLPDYAQYTMDDYAKLALKQSYRHSLTFPWIRERLYQQRLTIHLWFFDIKTGQIFVGHPDQDIFTLLSHGVIA